MLTALPTRLAGVPLSPLTPESPVVRKLLAGTLVGAWAGASRAVRMRTATLHRVLAGMLVLVALALYASHEGTVQPLDLSAAARVPVGVAAGFFIGVVAAVMGVAGGELLILTILLLYAVDIKTAGSLSLAVSLPTMLVAFARYSRDGSFNVLRDNGRFVVLMAGGSVAGTVLGGLAVGVVPDAVLPEAPLLNAPEDPPHMSAACQGKAVRRLTTDASLDGRLSADVEAIDGRSARAATA